MTELFALDLGNRQVKMMTRKNVKVFPSYFIDAAEFGNRTLLNFSKGESTTSDYASARDGDFTYVWGRGLRVRNKFVNDSIRFDNRYSSREYKLLVDFALAEMARDFDEAAAGNTLDVVLVAGVPTDDFNSTEIAEQLSKSLKGVHAVNIDGVDYVINVKEVHALPQPVGTFIDATVDDEGNVKEGADLIDALVGIVDVGGGTIIVDALDDMNLQTDFHNQESEGAFYLYERIRDAIVATGRKISVYEVETFVREGNERELYTWSPNGNETIDFTKQVMIERKRYTRRAVSLVLSTYKDLSSFKAILFTGGTSNLLVKDEVLSEIPMAIFGDESEIANVRGFYKFGLNSELV